MTVGFPVPGKSLAIFPRLSSILTVLRRFLDYQWGLCVVLPFLRIFSIFRPFYHSEPFLTINGVSAMCLPYCPIMAGPRPVFERFSSLLGFCHLTEINKVVRIREKKRKKKWSFCFSPPYHYPMAPYPKPPSNGPIRRCLADF